MALSVGPASIQLPLHLKNLRLNLVAHLLVLVLRLLTLDFNNLAELLNLLSLRGCLKLLISILPVLLQLGVEVAERLFQVFLCVRHGVLLLVFCHCLHNLLALRLEILLGLGIHLHKGLFGLHKRLLCIFTFFSCLHKFIFHILCMLFNAGTHGSATCEQFVLVLLLLLQELSVLRGKFLAQFLDSGSSGRFASVGRGVHHFEINLQTNGPGPLSGNCAQKLNQTQTSA